MVQSFTYIEILVIMAVIIALLIIPVITWYVRRHYMKKRTSTPPPPLMYITAVSSRGTDIDTPVTTQVNEHNYLPPTYEEIVKGMSQPDLEVISSNPSPADEVLPDYESVASHRSSAILSTFYNDRRSSVMTGSQASLNTLATGSEVSIGELPSPPPPISDNQNGSYSNRAFNYNSSHSDISVM